MQEGTVAAEGFHIAAHLLVAVDLEFGDQELLQWELKRLVALVPLEYESDTVPQEVFPGKHVAPSQPVSHDVHGQGLAVHSPLPGQRVLHRSCGSVLAGCDIWHQKIEADLLVAG